MGIVRPDVAVLFGCGTYVAVLMAGCLLPSLPLRAVVALSAGEGGSLGHPPPPAIHAK